MLSALILFALSGAVAAQPFDADRYVHVEFTPEKILDMSPRPPHASTPKKMDIRYTGYTAEIHLYLAPGEKSYPKFAFGELNVRRQNHQWLRVPLYHEIAAILSSEEVNRVLKMSVTGGDVLSRVLKMGNKMTVYEFPPAHTIFMLDSSKLGTFEGLQEVVLRHIEGTLQDIGADGNLQLLLSLPTEEVTNATPSRVPMSAQVTYSQIERDPARTVLHWKQFEGYGERKALVPAEKEMLKMYFELRGCDTRLKRQ